jgi:hypothetical protein
MDPGLAIPDQRPRQAAEPLKAAGDPGQQILRLRREDQHAGARARVAQARDHDPAAARLAVPDRHPRARQPDVELDDLARPIDGPLERARRRREQRPHPA